MEKDINVKNIINSNIAVSSDQGKELFNVLQKNISNNIISNVYFTGISVVTTAFLNKAVGDLYQLTDSNTLNKFIKIKTKGLTKPQFEKITLVMKNSKRRLTKEETDKKIF